MSENKTKADEIWNLIKDVAINIYALSGQTIEMHVKRLPVTDNVLHCKLKAAAVLPVLEEAIQHLRLKSKEKLEVSQQRDFVVITPVLDIDALTK